MQVFSPVVLRPISVMGGSCSESSSAVLLSREIASPHAAHDTEEAPTHGITDFSRLALTRALLVDLESKYPLQRAAAELGLSPAALRRECSRLGHPAWSYRPRATSTPPVHTLAYTRKIFRKYSKVKSPRPGPKPATAAAAAPPPERAPPGCPPPPAPAVVTRPPDASEPSAACEGDRAAADWDAAWAAASGDGDALLWGGGDAEGAPGCGAADPGGAGWLDLE